MPVHPLTRRWFAEDLVRLRRAGEQRRYLASQRAGRVDPNPHQIDAVVFALRRIPEGGCILADEVGLGKTIEAGLVLAQLRAEGKDRILLITPKPLLGQWREELRSLFGLETREGSRDGGIEGPGIVMVGREFAGSEVGSALLLASGGFDLAIIDEAHEIFAGIYRRYDRKGQLGSSSRYAKTAARVKAVLVDTPVLLLTATPIQNALTELWGLVQYVEPTQTLLGDLPTFRTLFCDGDDRRVRPGQDEELRRRIATVCQRTLRRQAEAFMQRRFVRRSARLFAYAMTPEERSLYDDVTAYLMRPDLVAFGGANRRLLLISFHRRMASSTRALADSLSSVLARLERRARTPTLDLFRADLEEEDDDNAAADMDGGDTPVPEGDRLFAEIAEVRALATRARALPVDSKALQLLTAVRFVLDRAAKGEGSGKAVIFTEAISTQDYLVEVLCGAGLLTRDEITVYRGANEGARVQEAEAAWEREVGAHLPAVARPSAEVARRMALVHEFSTRTKLFISTEAGAKGLNLQFCETVVNYDLPWNPQRIEQRIGRCHRYGQTRDVTVINFLAEGNEAQRLTFDLLSRKLELFGTVLSASDVVLHEGSETSPGRLLSALGADFEAQLQDVYARSRTPAELTAALEGWGETLDAQRRDFEETHARTTGLIEARLDETVRATFRQLEAEIPDTLRTMDTELEGVLVRYLEASRRAFTRTTVGACVRFEISASGGEEGDAGMPAVVMLGPEPDDEAEPLHLGHRLIRAAVEEARRATRQPFFVTARADEVASAVASHAGRDPAAPSERRSLDEVAPALASRAGPPEQGPRKAAARADGVATRGRLTVLRATYGGYEPATQIFPVVVTDRDERPWSLDQATALLTVPSLADRPGGPLVVDPSREESIARSLAAKLADAVEEVLFVAQGEVDAREQVRFEAAMDRIERAIEDRIAVLLRARQEKTSMLAEAQRKRAAASGAMARTAAERECAELQEEVDHLDLEVDRLRRRDDADYQQWRLRAHERRYTPPRWERLVEAEFELL